MKRHVGNTSGQFISVDVIVFTSVAHVESSPQLFRALQTRSVPTLIGRVMAEVIDNLTSQGVSFPLEANHCVKVILKLFFTLMSFKILFHTWFKD